MFFLSNVGGYVTGGTRLRAVADWGVMVNVGQRDAAGGSFFTTLEDEIVAGPALRYRRWLGEGASLDLAVGTPIVGDNKPGSLYGLLKWNPVHWFGIAVRPEVIRRTEYRCGAFECTPATRSRVQISLGLEAGWVPGLVLTASGGLVLALVALRCGACP